MREGATVHVPVRKLPREVQRKAEWRGVILSSKKSLQTAILSRMRSDEAANGWKGVGPQSSNALAGVLSDRYDCGGDVSGP